MPPGQDPLGRDWVVAWAFVLVQLVLIALVVLFASGADGVTLDWLSVASRVLVVAGLVVIAIGLVSLGRSATPLPTPVRDGTLRSNGLYRYVRHPIYMGVMSCAVGAAIASGSVRACVTAVALGVWLVAKARWEEPRLMARYPGYATYAQRTPRFIPSVRRRS